MSFVKRLTAIIASGFSLAAIPEAHSWKTPRPAPDHPTANVRPPPRLPEQPKTPVGPSRSALTSGELIIFATGFVLSAAAAVGIWMLVGSDSSLAPEAPGTTISAATPPQPASLASAQLSSCPQEPAAAAASDKDGRFPLQASVAGLIAADITSFMVIGNQAVAAGRPRDAEAAFLMSCRVAENLMGAGSVELADAKYHLAAHYAKLAVGGGGTAGTDRAELLGRAESLYVDSLQTTVARYGEADEKSRLAADGLAAVRKTLAQGENLHPVPGPAPKAAPEVVTGSVGLQKQPEPAPSSAGVIPSARPVPATNDQGKSRQDHAPLPSPSASSNCPDAVAALGLCNPGK